MTKNNKGFTLMELMVTVAIILIIGSVSITAVSSYITKSEKAAEVVAAQNNKYVNANEGVKEYMANTATHQATTSTIETHVTAEETEETESAIPSYPTYPTSSPRPTTPTTTPTTTVPPTTTPTTTVPPTTTTTVPPTTAAPEPSINIPSSAYPYSSTNTTNVNGWHNGHDYALDFSVWMSLFDDVNMAKTYYVTIALPTTIENVSMWYGSATIEGYGEGYVVLKMNAWNTSAALYVDDGAGGNYGRFNPYVADCSNTNPLA